MALVCRTVPSPLFELPVRHVRRVRAEEEMIDIHAAPLVTPMANMHRRWNRAVLDLPGPAVSKLDDALEIHLAIAGAIDAGLPDQAAGDGIALGEVHETLLGSPMRGAVQHAPGRRIRIGFHAPKIRQGAPSDLLWAMAFAIP